MQPNIIPDYKDYNQISIRFQPNQPEHNYQINQINQINLRSYLVIRHTLDALNTPSYYQFIINP